MAVHEVPVHWVNIHSRITFYLFSLKSRSGWVAADKLQASCTTQSRHSQCRAKHNSTSQMVQTRHMASVQTKHKHTTSAHSKPKSRVSNWHQRTSKQFFHLDILADFLSGIMCVITSWTWSQRKVSALFGLEFWLGTKWAYKMFL